jgi:hypothetical protein
MKEIKNMKVVHKGSNKKSRITQAKRIATLEEIVIRQHSRISSIDSKLEQLIRVLTVKKGEEVDSNK